MPFTVLAILFLLIYPASCLGQVFQPGFRTMGMRSEEPAIRIDISIWYPTLRQPKDLQYPPWTINSALNAKPAEGRFPLLVLSHASPADRFAYHNLASFLAREGFIVAAPTHRNDWMNNMDSLFTWAQLADRVRDINAVISTLLSEKDFAACLDQNRIGVIGFGSGGAAALLLGGALPTASIWAEYCPKAGKKDVYCSSWAQEKMNAMCANFPIRRSLANPRIKAVAAIAPGFGMLFGSDSFRYFYTPLLLVCAGKDQFNTPRLHCEPIARILGSKARILELPTADENALIAPCPPALAEELPELCQSVTIQERNAVHQKLSQALLAFFEHYLGVTGNIPIIPDPPDLEPETAPEAPITGSRRRAQR